MSRVATPLILVLALAACAREAEEPSSAAEAEAEEEDLPPRPEKVGDEPAVVTVKHVLIMFKGAHPRATATRSKAEAEKLAYDVLGWAKEGKDFDALMKQHSDDPGPGTYVMVNEGLEPRGSEGRRSGMVKAFGDVSFRLNVDEIGITMWNGDTSPFGYHILRRVK